jgi:hypothetical protein
MATALEEHAPTRTPMGMADAVTTAAAAAVGEMEEMDETGVNNII